MSINFNFLITNIFVLLLLTIGCSDNSKTIISGNIDYLGDADFYFYEKPLHYKYSPVHKYFPDLKGSEFSLEIPLNHPKILWMVIQDKEYPVYLEPDEQISIEIFRSDFPGNVTVRTGENENIWNSNYQLYLDETVPIDKKLANEADNFSDGKISETLLLSQEKLDAAETHLKDGTLHALYLREAGNDLIYRLRAIEYKQRSDKNYNAEQQRKNLLSYADSIGFFNLESLKAQRAGIRDFTHYYSRTFGIYDSVVSEYGELSEYDIKRLAYPALDKKRREVIGHILTEEARAYAQLFLVAERIGELPLETAEPSYNNYLKNYADYSVYTNFLKDFYSEIKSVSPGEPAIPFSLPDINGRIYTLKDVKGKYVLLDFWAGWCQPCIDEFDDMRLIYASYPRDKFEILAISTELDSLTWVNDIKRFKNPWPQLYGGNGFDQTTFNAYKGSGIPFYILLDPNGNIVRYNDIRPSFNLRAVLDTLITN